MLIQYVLIFVAGWLLTVFLRNHGTTRASAGAKICFLGFVVFSVFAVLRPGDISALANALGVGRGTDLLVYAIAAGFAFMSLHTYLRFKELQLRQAQLARAVALRDAREPQTSGDSVVDAEVP